MSQKPPGGREDLDREEQLAISHARAYPPPGVRVFYDRGRCLHFAECLRGLPEGLRLCEAAVDRSRRTPPQMR